MGWLSDISKRSARPPIKGRKKEKSMKREYRQETLLEVLMRRDRMTKDEAQDAIDEARELVLNEGMDPDEVLREEFGLEPDYVFDLLGDV